MFKKNQLKQEAEMNKAELVEEIAGQTGLTKRTSREAVDAIISAITDSLAGEERVTENCRRMPHPLWVGRKAVSSER